MKLYVGLELEVEKGKIPAAGQNLDLHGCIEIFHLPRPNEKVMGVSKGDPVKGRKVLTYVGEIKMTVMAHPKPSPKPFKITTQRLREKSEPSTPGSRSKKEMAKKQPAAPPDTLGTGKRSLKKKSATKAKRKTRKSN